MDRSKFIHETYTATGKSYGITTDVFMLPVGTKFRVINGYWYGEIIEEDGEKKIHILERNGERTGRKIILNEYVDHGLVIEINKN